MCLAEKFGTLMLTSNNDKDMASNLHDYWTEAGHIIDEINIHEMPGLQETTVVRFSDNSILSTSNGLATIVRPGDAVKFMLTLINPNIPELKDFLNKRKESS